MEVLPSKFPGVPKGSGFYRGSQLGRHYHSEAILFRKSDFHTFYKNFARFHLEGLLQNLQQFQPDFTRILADFTRVWVDFKGI